MKEEDLDRELTDEELDMIVGGGKYDTHGQGYNNGKACNDNTRGKEC